MSEKKSKFNMHFHKNTHFYEEAIVHVKQSGLNGNLDFL